MSLIFYYENNVKLKVVRTKRGALLHMREISKNYFFLEQNPLKDSKYGVAYVNSYNLTSKGFRQKASAFSGTACHIKNFGFFVNVTELC